MATIPAEAREARPVDRVRLRELIERERAAYANAGHPQSRKTFAEASDSLLAGVHDRAG